MFNVMPSAVLQREIKELEEDKRRKEERKSKKKKRKRGKPTNIFVEESEAILGKSTRALRTVPEIRRSLFNETVHDGLVQLRMVEHYSLSLIQKVAILECLCNLVLETTIVRTAIDCRERETQDNKKEKRRNWDHCGLCFLGGNLVCCDTCPGAYHLKVCLLSWSVKWSNTVTSHMIYPTVYW